MSTVILKGDEAVHYAEAHGLKLCCDAEGDDHPRADMSPAEARDIVEAHPERVWIEVHVGINSGEHVEH